MGDKYYSTVGNLRCQSDCRRGSSGAQHCYNSININYNPLRFSLLRGHSMTKVILLVALVLLVQTVACDAFNQKQLVSSKEKHNENKLSQTINNNNNNNNNSNSKLQNAATTTSTMSSSGSITQASSTTPTSSGSSTTTTTASSLPTSSTTTTTTTTTVASTSAATVTKSDMRGDLSASPSSISSATVQHVAPPSSTERTSIISPPINRQQTGGANSARTSTQSSEWAPIHRGDHSMVASSRKDIKLENKKQRTSGEHLEQQSTMRSLSYSEPTTGSPIVPQRKSATGSNRWTHFGARLRPLTNGLAALGSNGDHHLGAASNSKPAGIKPMQQRSASPLTNNRVDSSVNGDDDDDDDDLDSEALLYKMMQQQNFLMNPIWQQNEQPQRPNSQSQNNNNLLRQDSGAQQQQQQQPFGLDNNNNNNNSNNNKKVIKLLKSYSHIHQVDDSDDQLRGTYTRLSSQRPQQQQHQQRQYNRQADRQIDANHRQRPQSSRHIFVSSKPLPSSMPMLAATERRPSGQVYGNNNQYGNNNNNNGPNDGNGADHGESAPSGANGEDQSGSEEDDFECPNNGIFADVASGCQAYHVCQSGAQVQQKFQCPLGTLFNDIILTCDFAHNVQCNGKPKPMAPAGWPTSTTQSEPQQQVPRASVQLDLASYAPIRPQTPPQQQQARWSQPAAANQNSGPRQLQIGQQPASQYSRHHQQQQSSLAQAIGAYPPQKPAATNNNNNQVDNDDDDMDDPIEPLVPATLPPSPRLTTLPYNPPPKPTQQYRPQQQQQVGRQSAHLSQYPHQHHQHQQHQFGNGQDESRTTEATNAVATHQDGDGTAQSFNLVIDHVAPPTHKSHVPSVVNGGASKPVSNKVAPPVNKPPTGSNNVVARQQAHGTINQPTARQHQQAAPSQSMRPRNYQQQQQHQQQQRLLAPTQPTIGLVDLTNAKQAQSVGADAMNDGLLLIVRHSSGSNPLQVTNGKAFTGKRATKPNQSALAQAYAVNPVLVNPSSPIDAQLFPNVQRALTASATSSSPSPLVPKSTPKANNFHHNHHTATTNSRVLVVAAPLPPMEPPKPQPDHSSDQNELNYAPTTFANFQTQPKVTTQNPIAQQQQQQQLAEQKANLRAKRTKRLRAVQAPPKAKSTNLAPNQ